MEKYEISIIVPIYNVEKYLVRCLDSILSQTINNYEVILIDDGSTDNSSTICDKYVKSYNNFQVLHKKNQGLGFARNSGLDLARGKYIYFLDGDDYIEKDHLNNLYTNIKTNNSDICMCGYTRYINGKFIKKENIYLNQKFNNSEIINELLPRFCGKTPGLSDNLEMSVCMAMFSRKIIEDNKIRFKSERELISEDLIFDFSVYPHAKLVTVSDSVGYIYCDNEGSLTTKYRSDRFLKQIVLAKELEKLSTDLGVYDKCMPRVINTFIEITRYSIKLEQKFWRTNGKRKAKQNIKEICNDNFLDFAWKNYNDSNLGLKNKIVNYLIKGKHYRLIWIIMGIKNKFNI